jgi:acyl-CoA synthetase (AMP-forming)/AMP-acid ligase II
MIFRAPEQPIAIPEVPLTPLLLERAAAHGEKPAFIDGPTGRILTYRGWADAVRRTAAGFAQRGLRKGDVLAIYSPNLPEYAVIFHAVSLIGGIVTTINPLYTAEELAAQLEDSRARSLVTTPAFREKAEEAARRAGVAEILIIGETTFEAAGDPPLVPIDPRRDLVVMPYSSGTTGLPKGVMLSHHNLVANLLQSANVIGVNEGDTVIGVLPFFHIYGMVVIMNLSLYVGATVVTMPRFDLEQFLETVEKYRVTFAYLVPPIVLALAKHPLVDKYDLSRVRAIFSGAAPLSGNVAQAASTRLACDVRQGYGLTETSPVTHTVRTTLNAASVGPPLPNTEVKIVDVATGAELGPNQEGEICIRGPQVMQGYLNRPDATRAMIDREGWLHSGDIGYADDEGCFYIVDRVKELIKYKGLQIAPAELEAVLLAHPSIADAAVIPLQDEEAGQVPKAFVVLKADATADQIMGFVSERVAPYKKLRSVEITDQIPKSPSGKILRRLLVARDAAR